ncbi:MAG TPA: hypothetical protein VMU39_17570 [Solirubrobacteraceae bacterium]|nr:hypothetical protein [Solirubrobacteraceae bacterium]
MLDAKLNKAESLRTTLDGPEVIVVSGADAGGGAPRLTVTVPAREQLFFWLNGCSLLLMSTQTKSA